MFLDVFGCFGCFYGFEVEFLCVLLLDFVIRSFESSHRLGCIRSGVLQFQFANFAAELPLDSERYSNSNSREKKFATIFSKPSGAENLFK